MKITINPDGSGEIQFAISSEHFNDVAADAKKMFGKAKAIEVPDEDTDFYFIADGVLYYENTSKAAAALGRKGGSRTSERKAAASAENGRKGGRPRKQ